IIEVLNGPRVDILGNPVQVGDRVVWAYPPCGKCYWCNVAMVPAACPTKPSWGHNPIDKYPYLLGSCAEYMYIMPQCQIVKVPTEVSRGRGGARGWRLPQDQERLRPPRTDQEPRDGGHPGLRAVGHLRHRRGARPGRQPDPGHRRAGPATGAGRADGRRCHAG